jgi:hypothetical protein
MLLANELQGPREILVLQQGLDGVQLFGYALVLKEGMDGFMAVAADELGVELVELARLQMMPAHQLARTIALAKGTAEGGW